MRFHTAITASRRSDPKVRALTFPNPDAEPEIEISFGGLGVWLSISEAEHLSHLLASAAVEARSEAAL